MDCDHDRNLIFACEFLSLICYIYKVMSRIIGENCDNQNTNRILRYKPSVVEISSTVTLRGKEAADRAILKPA